MAAARFRVDIDGDPFVLRSAVFQHLRSDPRFDVVLVGSTHDTVDVAAHDATDPGTPGTAVLTVRAEGPLSLQRVGGGAPYVLAYENMHLLTETLVRELTTPSSSVQTRVTDHA